MPHFAAHFMCSSTHVVRGNSVGLLVGFGWKLWQISTKTWFLVFFMPFLVFFGCAAFMCFFGWVGFFEPWAATRSAFLAYLCCYLRPRINENSEHYKQIKPKAT